MTKPTILFALVACLACGVALAGETITAQEVEWYFYADGEMKRSKGQFEITYYIEEKLSLGRELRPQQKTSYTR